MLIQILGTDVTEKPEFAPKTPITAKIQPKKRVLAIRIFSGSQYQHNDSTTITFVYDVPFPSQENIEKMGLSGFSFSPLENFVDNNAD